MTTLKSAYEKGQSWLTNRVEKFANLKYDKLKPRIISRGALSYCDGDDENQRCLRSRIHSIDVGDLGRNYENYRNRISLDTPRHSGENFLSSSSNELTLLHKTPHNNMCKRIRCKRERVMVKSIEDVNGDIKVVPSFLLTYNSKFSKISNETYQSCSSINISEIYEDSSEV